MPKIIKSLTESKIKVSKPILINIDELQMVLVFIYSFTKMVINIGNLTTVGHT